MPGITPITDSHRRPLRDLRISVMDRCNFRCSYCMPRETFHDRYRFLEADERLTFDEITRLARLFVSLGVRKVRLTGGEPLLRRNLPELVGELSAIGGVEDLALTTNGVLLDKHAAELQAKGLMRVTVSLDSLDENVFKRMNGGFGGRDRVLAGIHAAREAGLAPLKVNAVIERGVNDAGALDLLEHFRFTGVVVRFIEYMDVGNRNRWTADRVVPSEELMRRIHARWPLRPVAGHGHDNSRGEVAQQYAFADGGGEVGFISSVTEAFCGDCSRARLSSDGIFYTCLFATHGHDLRAPLRSGASDRELLRQIQAVWTARTDRYSEQRTSLREMPLRKIEMYAIGG